MFHEISGTLFQTVSLGNGARTFLGFGAWVFGWELWQSTMEVLSRDWRVAGFDQRGSGETLSSPESISLTAMVDDVFRVMDALDVERCTLGDEHLRSWARHIGERGMAPTAVAAHQAFLGADVRSHLGGLTVPVLLVHGAVDQTVPVEIARANAAAIPRSELVVIEGVGHGLTLSKPGEVADAIDAFVGSQSRRG